MAALGMTVVIVAGGIDLSVGSIIALTTVVIALLLRAGRQPAGRGARRRRARRRSAASSTACSSPSSRVVPFIVTLGTMLVVRGAAKGLAEERRIEAPVTWLNDLLRVPRGRGLAARRASGRVIVLALVVAGAAALHAVRPARVRDRIERAHGAAVRRRDHADEGRSSTRSRRRWPAWPGCCSSRSCRSAIRPSRSASSST